MPKGKYTTVRTKAHLLIKGAIQDDDEGDELARPKVPAVILSIHLRMNV